MSLQLGTSPIKSVYLGGTKIKEAYLGGTKVLSSGDPYNPLGLPPFTIRCKFRQGITPAPYTQSGYTPSWTSQSLVDAAENVWDIVRESNNWGEIEGTRYGIMYSQSDLLAVLGANTTGVTSLKYAFGYCGSLEELAVFDTSAVTNMSYAFNRCGSLTEFPLFPTHNVTDFSCMCFGYSWSGWLPLRSIPLLDTSSAVDVTAMFRDTKNVESGALALYQQMSTQANPPSVTGNCFTNCGSATVTGAAELAQIPSSWGGTGA